MPRSDNKRRCGVLLHPTSLPGPGGIGEIGTQAYRFVDFLAAAGQGVWQVLPLGPVGDANSPYDGTSAFAGNPLLISEEWLVEYGLLNPSDIEEPLESTDHADFELARARKHPILRAAFERFKEDPHSQLARRFDTFCRDEAYWLDDVALFRSIRDSLGGLPWIEWDEGLRTRDPDVLDEWRAVLAWEIHFQEFVQFVFDEQWRALRQYANDRGVRIMGDIPIYVSLDSTDVWAHQNLFELDEAGRPTVVAGVPPDYFSESGQLWGNPCYRWDELEKSRYRWWVQRFRRTFDLADMARLDHFRAFQAGWQVTFGDETAINGRWVEGPGIDLFISLEEAFGSLPIVVEDLGLITDDVHELRENLDLPGMKVLQFAFGGGNDNPYLPHNYDSNCVVYTGTHDNDTTMGWFNGLDEITRTHLTRYLGYAPSAINWAMIRLAYESVAELAVVPAQDLLGLGSECRMNVPGTVDNDWEWRLLPESLTDDTAIRLRDLAALYRRTAD